MNKLPPFQTIKHALKAVLQFRNAGVRIGLPWILVLAAMSVMLGLMLQTVTRLSRDVKRLAYLAQPAIRPLDQAT